MLISDLVDKSAKGIVRAADQGVIERGNVRNTRAISEARDLVDEGKGGWIFTGFNLRTQEPIWKQPGRRQRGGA